jgi:CheY-like chemotaxis protein
MEKKRILMIDDEPSFTRLIKLNLEQIGPYDVRVENDGKRAFEAAREFRPHLVLLDVIMPGVDGGEVAAQIRADPQLKETPIVFLTAVVSRETVSAKGEMIGGNTFLAKPVTVLDVVASIEKHLAH